MQIQPCSMALSKTLSCLLLLLCVLKISQAQNSGNITLGSNITAGSNSSWPSQSGEFAFGFYNLSTGSYLVGIWFNRIPERTLIWSANRDHLAVSGSVVSLTNSGQLQLTYANGSVQPIYSGVGASFAVMQNDGNFVLRESNSASVWESFDSPTDTLLPGQTLGPRGRLYANAKGTTNYSTGNFMLEMQRFDGKLVLSAYHFADPGYWLVPTFSENNVSLVFDRVTALMYLVNISNQNIYPLTMNVTTPTENYYHRATIDANGNFQQYTYQKSNGTRWISVWSAISEPCLVNSVCGVYGLCSSPDNGTVECNCLPGYVPLEPSDVSKGCRPETVTNYCADESMRNFSIQVIEDANIPYQDVADFGRLHNLDPDECQKAFVEECYALAASWYNSTCYMKKIPLLTARVTPSTRGNKVLIKVPFKANTTYTRDVKGSKSKRMYLKAGVIISSVLACIFGVLAVYYHPFARKLIRGKVQPDPATIGIFFREFTYKELQQATNGFNSALGKGSSAIVYPGVILLKETRVEIAVKKLNMRMGQAAKEFLTELRIIGRTYHKNLVKLLGFCIEDDHLLLVYELMKNGTLSDFLFKETIPMWSQRSEMALGIARGLLYLHEECESQIIHCDIKPQNVLLDAEYNAKIADFGLSKLFTTDQSKTITGARGTVGYMAPEWLKNVPITSKVDVYSFGVMLLEICCARRHIDPDRVEEETDEDDLLLKNWVLSRVKSNKVEELVKHDPEVISDIKRFETYILVGLWCLHLDPILRPSMKKVYQMLEGAVEVGIPPLLYE